MFFLLARLSDLIDVMKLWGSSRGQELSSDLEELPKPEIWKREWKMIPLENRRLSEWLQRNFLSLEDVLTRQRVWMYTDDNLENVTNECKDQPSEDTWEPAFLS